jgi:hypothetical protein
MPAPLPIHQHHLHKPPQRRVKFCKGLPLIALVESKGDWMKLANHRIPQHPPVFQRHHRHIAAVPNPLL